MPPTFLANVNYEDALKNKYLPTGSPDPTKQLRLGLFFNVLMIIQDRNLAHLNSFIIIKVSQVVIHHRLKNKDLGKTTTKGCLIKIIIIMIAGLSHINAFIFTVAETAHVQECFEFN